MIGMDHYNIANSSDRENFEKFASLSETLDKNDFLDSSYYVDKDHYSKKD